MNNYKDMNEAASSLTAGINDHLHLGKHSHKALERADASFSGRISPLTPNSPLSAWNMEAFMSQIQAEHKELLETSLAFTGRHSSVMQSASVGSITSANPAGVEALAPAGHVDLDESTWRGLP